MSLFVWRRQRRGYALVTVTVLVGVALSVLAGVAAWTSANLRNTERYNLYSRAVSAAEAGTEKALASMMADFKNQAFSSADLGVYSGSAPSGELTSLFEFSDGNGQVGKTYVYSSPTMVTTNLSLDLNGLYGTAYTCKVRSNARALEPAFSGLAAAVSQDFQLASVPIFQFAIFYGMDLEICPGPNMKITGKVHSNASLFLAPGATLQFLDAVTSTGDLFYHRKDNTNTYGTTPLFASDPLPHSGSLTLPVGTNSSFSSVHDILRVPPASEDYHSADGQQRYYNLCDLIVTTTDSGVTVQSGRWGGMSNLLHDVTATNSSGYSFINTNASCYDSREGKTSLLTEIDVGALSTWMANTSSVGGAALNYGCLADHSKNIRSIYVSDRRTNSGRFAAVRVTNGRTLPPDGLTVATERPLYVKGNFNAPDVTVGSTNTSATKPSSLVADSITVLSGNWSDANSRLAVTSRSAANTTVNAAFLAGIVETTNGVYSGGVENFPRFLEDWGTRSQTLTYNGSMVVLFPSQYATNKWLGPGTGSGCYYNAPTRSWAFDVNFLDNNKLPPGTPQVRMVVRNRWMVLSALAPN